MSNVEKKLKEARYFLKRMQETYLIPFEFECNLQAFISSSRSVTFIMQKEYSDKLGFYQWYQKKQDQMRADETLSFFKEARTTSIHLKPLNVGTMAQFKEVYINSVPQGWGFAITGKGEPIWITPKGERMHAAEFDKNTKRFYYFDDPPRSFLGAKLRDFSVSTLCNLYFVYLSILVEELNEKYGVKKVLSHE